MAAYQVFPRRWVGRRTPSKTTHDGSRSVLDDVIAIPEVHHSDDDNEAETSSMFDVSGPSVEKTILKNRTRPSAEIQAWDSNPVQQPATFRVVSYNILTDNCIRDGDYGYCPADVRYMDTRHGRILAEIRTLDADVVCLQEADGEHFRKRLKPEMKELGYVGVNQATSDGQGLATFWRLSMFEMVKTKSRLLSEAVSDHLKRSSCTDASTRSAIENWSRRPEVTVMVHLRHLATGREIAVSNNHIAWLGLSYPTLQALQIAVALREVVEFVDPVTSSLIFCGDFNTPPSFPAYRLLSRSRLSRKAVEKFAHENDHTDEIDRRNFSAIADVIPDIFQLPIKLESAYVSVLGREPSVTNCDGAHEDGIVRSFCLDYIWYRKLKPVQVLETPSVAVLTEHVALPSSKFPSDHSPIAAEFLLN